MTATPARHETDAPDSRRAAWSHPSADDADDALADNGDGDGACESPRPLEAAELGDDESVSGPAGTAAADLAQPLDTAELAALIARVMNQDQAALAALYDALSGRVYAAALRITRQVALAEEVLQDCFWQVWRQAPRFDAQRGNAVAWVMNIARSRALDAVRGAQRDQLHQQALEQEPEPSQAIGLDPSELLSLGQRDGRLQQTLAALDPLKRQLIALAYYRGLTQDEIAAQTGLPLGTVKSHLRRTLAALRLALEGGAGGNGQEQTA